jgi:hypothetical protein
VLKLNQASVVDLKLAGQVDGEAIMDYCERQRVKGLAAEELAVVDSP